VPTKASEKVGSRFKVQDSRFKIPDSRFQIPDSRFQIQGFRFQVPGANNSPATEPAEVAEARIPNFRFQVSSC